MSRWASYPIARYTHTWGKCYLVAAKIVGQLEREVFESGTEHTHQWQHFLTQSTKIHICILFHADIYSTEQSPSREAKWFSANSPHFMEPKGFITPFTRAKHLSLFWAKSIWSIPTIPLTKDPSYYYPPIYTPGSSKWSLSLKFPH